MSEQILKHGIFKEELKNRFLCCVEIDGEDTLCYIPSSCRLSNFVDLVGKTVLLMPVSSRNSRTKYSVFALSAGKEFIPLNMSIANRTVERNIKNRRFSLLGKRTHVKSEYIINGYKSDLYIEDTKTIIEIKSFLAFSAEAIFPTVYSKRAVEQLVEIERLLDIGYSACYIFVSLNSKVKEMTINAELLDFWNQFRRCIDKGMKIKGITLKLVDAKPIIHSSLRIIVSQDKVKNKTYAINQF